MVFLYRSLAIVLLFVVMSGASRADHMNGRYFGTAQAGGYILQLNQNGRSIQGTINTTAGDAFQLVGDTDGGDYGWGQLTGGETGSFELEWSRQGVTINMQGQRHSGSMVFANRPPPQPPAPPRRQMPEQGQQDTDRTQRQEQQGGVENRGPASGMPNVD